jgi:hypothetical protein
VYRLANGLNMCERRISFDFRFFLCHDKLMAATKRLGLGSAAVCVPHISWAPVQALFDHTAQNALFRQPGIE